MEAFGEECGKRERAELMDECLAIACGLWAGQPFEYHGRHYDVTPTEFPTIGHTIQQPRVPMWCVGAIGYERSMQRALAWDGLIPQVIDDGTRTSGDARGVGRDRDQLPGDDYDVDHRGRRVRALTCGVGRRRGDVVARDAVGRRRAGQTGTGDVRPAARRPAGPLKDHIRVRSAIAV